MNFNRKPLAPVLLPLALLSLMALLAGCRNPELGTQAYTIAVALDRVFEKQDTVQLAQATQLIDSQRDSGELTDVEAQRLSDLVAMARADDWSGARASLRQLLVDQTQW